MNPAILIDGYKTSHAKMYPTGTQYIYSNWTPRKSRIDGADSIRFFGLQYFIKKYLIEEWNQNFFKKSKEEVVCEVAAVLKNFCDDDIVRRLGDLHDLGYLPLEIKALPEGDEVPIGVPCFTIVNTHPDFFWLTNFLETILSCSIWQACTSATIANRFRKMLDKYALQSDPENKDFVQFQGHDFSMRGMSSLESACLSGAGHLLSFVGTDTIPATVFLANYYGADINNDLVGCSVPACYDDQTEILTENGFVKFSDLKNEKVAQYHENGSIDFVVPSNYVNKDYDGDMITFSKSKGYKYIDLCVTPNHRMVRFNIKKEKTEIFLAGDFSYHNRSGYSGTNKLIVAGLVTTNSSTLSALEKLRIAFQADGSLPSRSEKYHSGQIRFSLKKERKKERLLKILEECGFEYSISQYKNGYYSIWIKTNDFLFDKNFDWVVLDKSITWYKEFIEELSYWDGHNKQDLVLYSNNNKKAVDKIQAMSTLCGYKSQYRNYIDKRGDRKEIHSLIIDKNRSNVGLTNCKRSIEKYSGKIYCVTVPSGMIIVRRNNIVCICGNSEHSVMSMSFAVNGDEIETFRDLIVNKFPSGIISIVSDTYSLWDITCRVMPALKQDVLNRNGTVTLRPDSSRTTPQDIVCGTPPELRTWSYDNPEWNKAEEDGLVQCLWNIFGGSVNSAGYKVLSPKIKTIFGDAISYNRAEEICQRLMKNGFASTNIVFGIGSFTYQYNTRDTLGFAMKATYGVHDSEPYNLFKDPATDSGEKKSALGLIRVDKINGRYRMTEGVGPVPASGGCLRRVFYDGELLIETSLKEIRERMRL